MFFVVDLFLLQYGPMLLKVEMCTTNYKNGKFKRAPIFWDTWSQLRFFFYF